MTRTSKTSRSKMIWKTRYSHTSLWAGTGALEKVLKPLCSSIGYLEGDEATLSAVYACFLFIAHHLKSVSDSTLEGLGVDRLSMLDFVHVRLKTIVSSVHVLAFVTDPLFYDMRLNLARRYGQEFLNLGSEVGLFTQCRDALERIAGNDDELRAILAEQFAYFLAMRMEQTLFANVKHFKPWLIWAQVDDANLCHLARVLVQVHSNPSSAVGGERNHKTNSRVHSKQRIRLGEERCQRQVAIAFNAGQLERVLQKRREEPFLIHIANIGSECAEGISSGNPPATGDDLEDASDVPEDEFRIVEDPSCILDQYLGDVDDVEEIIGQGVVYRSQMT
ncbi:HAT C-terminal dimerization domain-containing protein [Plasmodiophora brassicae]|nr:hypothetical protein PBRA_005483 [Plasmodiophora brassicae]